MKTILCYGDSNTWGYRAVDAGRFPRWVRWPGVLQRELGNAFYVIEEGLPGRTTVWEDPIERHKNGAAYLMPCLESHKPLDLVVLMLGSNDLKKRFSLSAFDIAAGAGTLSDMIQRSSAGRDEAPPPVLLLAPPPLGELPPDFVEMFEGAHAKAPRLAGHYQRVAEELGCSFLDTTEFLLPSPVDGLHLEAEEHMKLGRRVAEAVLKIVQG